MLYMILYGEKGQRMDNNFGLKDKFDFREVNINYTRGVPLVPDLYLYCCLLDDFIAPAIEMMEEENLLNGFHFINHNGIDLRLSSLDWEKNKDRVEEILKIYGTFLTVPNLTSQEYRLHPYGDLNNDLVGIVAANFLETVSRCVLAEVRADGKASRFKLSHYLNNLYGFWNANEALSYLITGEYQAVVSLIHKQMNLKQFQQLMKTHRKKMKKMLKTSRSRKLHKFIGMGRDGVVWFLNKSGISKQLE